MTKSNEKSEESGPHVIAARLLRVRARSESARPHVPTFNLSAEVTLARLVLRPTSYLGLGPSVRSLLSP
jgi:hypothetical protein